MSKYAVSSMLLFHFQHSACLNWQQKHLLHCNWVTIMVYGNSRWFFLINGFFCATPQYKLLRVAGLYMCVTGAFSLHSHLPNSVAPSKQLSTAPLTSLLLVRAEGLETWPFLGSVWVVWYSILFPITPPALTIGTSEDSDAFYLGNLLIFIHLADTFIKVYMFYRYEWPWTL